jgi:hypothetical protein
VAAHACCTSESCAGVPAALAAALPDTASATADPAASSIRLIFKQHHFPGG